MRNMEELGNFVPERVCVSCLGRKAGGVQKVCVGVYVGVCEREKVLV